ncbi:hypothetical protein [Kosakonia sp. YIM B13611]|uniref:hypothetical protein n=1 Tax=unclassified Kosakonia TaxID=2632876 RepID=UPI003696431B
MIYDQVRRLFLDCTQSTRLVRYDVITKRNGDCVVKVTDVQNKGAGNPQILVEIDEFDVTQNQYNQDYGLHSPQTKVHMAGKPNFEQYVDQILQDHRGKLG